MDLPSDIDIPLKEVQIPATPSAEGSSLATPAVDAADCVRAVLKYRNDDGRNSILAVAKAVHHDFGQFNSSLAVSLAPADLEDMKSNSNIDWFEGDGKVIYCSIR